MSFVLNQPPSIIAREAKDSVDNEPKKKSREDYKKEKELEEARKAGTVPAMQDECGKDINPHIPQYIMQAPWYLNSKVPTLRHQRMPDEKKKVYAKLDQWAKKGIKEGPVATKYRKGACENCGAMTHKKMDCLERPRKIGARYTDDNIAPDEHLPHQLEYDFEGKRDIWKSYETETYNEDMQEDADKLEDAKRQLKTKKLDEIIESGETSEIKARHSDDEDELKYADDADMPGQKFETKQRITVRNLRIREDTAKYLLNLDVESAHYDPKTRALRGDPLAGSSKEGITSYQGENFARATGDSIDMAKQQLFAWEAYDKGADVHLQADPTKLELLKREYGQRKKVYDDDQKNEILEKYGGEEHLAAPPKQLLLAQTENYVEYSRSGAVIKGQERAEVKSRYEENLCFNNHTAVWGSYWNAGKWGYKCCYSTIKESYCTGAKGREAALESQKVPETTPIEAGESEKTDEKQTPKSLMQQHQERQIEERLKALEKEKKKKKAKRSAKKKKIRSRKDSSSSSSSTSDSSTSNSSSSEDEEAEREKRIQQIMIRQEAEERRVKSLLKKDERKRSFNSMAEHKEPTEEEMEAYRRRQKHNDDPMNRFM